ncbi:unnamed protein product, partial [Porites evermanni]
KTKTLLVTSKRLEKKISNKTLKIKRNLLLAGRKLLFNALIKPILLYGSYAWTRRQRKRMRIRNEDDCPDYVTKLLPRNSDLRSDSKASRYGRFNLVRPFYNRETEGGRTFKVSGAKLWNRIPLDMRKKDTAGAFKNALVLA